MSVMMRDHSPRAHESLLHLGDFPLLSLLRGGALHLLPGHRGHGLPREGGPGPDDAEGVLGGGEVVAPAVAQG